MTDDDMEIISVRLPLTRAQIASLDRLVDMTFVEDAERLGLKSRTAYIWSLLMTSINDEMEDHAGQQAA